MQLPDTLQIALDSEIESVSTASLRQAALSLSQQYRCQKKSESIFNYPSGCQAYLAVRMPATFAAICHAIIECRGCYEQWQPKSLIDFGAGPGTGGWASIQELPSIETITCIEPNQTMASIGKRLAQAAPDSCLAHAKWLKEARDFSADIVLFSYVLGEMNQDERQTLLQKAWADTEQVIVIIEPGTPIGFKRILEIRQWALSMGAYLVAPCPHSEKCPIAGWCHFPARVERTRLHKLLKKGTLGFEDEKFSYLIFGKQKPHLPEGRIVDYPTKESGFVKIPLCTHGQIQHKIVSRKDSQYRRARACSYGDAWEIENEM